ncbi:MAG TPA: hypothetical protein VF142_12940 [Longimicrobium sp.]
MLVVKFSDVQPKDIPIARKIIGGVLRGEVRPESSPSGVILADVLLRLDVHSVSIGVVDDYVVHLFRCFDTHTHDKLMVGPRRFVA